MPRRVERTTGKTIDVHVRKGTRHLSGTKLRAHARVGLSRGMKWWLSCNAGGRAPEVDDADGDKHGRRSESVGQVVGFPLEQTNVEVLAHATRLDM